jgi:hypothetical protein
LLFERGDPGEPPIPSTGMVSTSLIWRIVNGALSRRGLSLCAGVPAVSTETIAIVNSARDTIALGNRTVEFISSVTRHQQ